MTQRLRPAMHREMLGGRDRLQIRRIVALHALDEGHAHLSGEEGILAVRLHAASPAGIANVPCHASITDGNGDERKELRAALQSKRLYVIDRGYAEYQLFQDIIDARSSFIGRIRANAVYQLIEERPLSEEAHKAGVLRDCVVNLGCEQSGSVFKQPLRVVEVATGKTDSQGRPEVLLLATNCLDLDAAWIALGYKFRWTVELFFRWFKCILGCQHLLSTCQNGVTIQVYLALIASLLVTLWTGHKPSKRTFEMLCLY